MTASSLVLRTRRRSCYQGRGDLHQARAAAPGPTAAEEKHIATLAKPRMVSSQVQLCVYSALHMDHQSRGGSFASAAPRRSEHEVTLRPQTQAEATCPVSSSLEDAHSELDNIIIICQTMDKNVDTSESS